MFAFGNGGPLNLPAIMKNATAFWGFDDASLATTVFDSTGRGNNLTRRMLPAVSTVPFTLGASEGPTQFVTGKLAPWGKWNRILTAAEMTALNGGEIWPFSTTTSLQDAVAYYLFTEAGGSTSYADATGRGNTLAKLGSGATVKSTGPFGGISSLQLDGTNYLIANPVTADLQTGNTAFTIAGWVNMSALGTTQQMFWGQFDANIRTGTVVYYHNANGAFQMDHGNDVDLYRNSGTVSTGLTPAISTWYFIVSQYDPVTNQTTQIINNSLTNHLTSIQQPIEVAGHPPGTAGHFRLNPDYRANTPNTSGWDLVGSEVFCSIAANADVGFGNNSKTGWCWVKFDDFTTTAVVAGCYDVTGTLCDWVLQVSAGSMFISTGNPGHVLATASASGVGDNNWHLIVWWYDKAANKLHLDIDHGAHVATPQTPSGTPATGTVTFKIGACSKAAAASTFDQQLAGAVDAFGVANGTPTQADLDALWNNGNGRNL